MRKFLAIYIGTEAGFERAQWHTIDEAGRTARRAAGMQAWKEWAAANAAAIIDMGGPLGKTISISPDGVSDIKNSMAAYTIIRAESHEDAAKLFHDRPHFTIFPGDSVEIMECMPAPGA